MMMMMMKNKLETKNEERTLINDSAFFSLPRGDNI
jgi:hypothetical protein